MCFCSSCAPVQTYTARLTNPAGTEMKISLSNGETITIGKGLSEGSITFPAPQNTVYVDGGNVSVTITGTTGGDFEHLEVSPSSANAEGCCAPGRYRHLHSA
ncbi:immunoglobulin-like domain-containing protein [Pseudomonas sp. 148P]|uniref:Immunoglobulin-like domain-containing protein n=1 Tax=Pseudomonas ulcerans TaxID=3115852 RepID=A0ABU7I1V7_9PSED|nr:immunoglobulin-like domain-containing protein [Pseudomonas sp. 148P]MEE1937812.1 immunoglobulin-like domain-containing protein [Pseudomonas sp. 148P]